MSQDPFANFINSNPLEIFKQWYSHAQKSGDARPDGMALSTVGKDGSPSSRMVLYKGINNKGILFFTNYESRKAQELKENPSASLLFHWPLLERQIRIRGTVERATRQENINYWNTRPRESQIGAMASHQSSILADRDLLQKKVEELTQEFEGKEIICPEYWGGYCVIPFSFEFWQGQKHRLHDRLSFVSLGAGQWKIQRLAP